VGWHVGGDDRRKPRITSNLLGSEEMERIEEGETSDEGFGLI